MAENNDGGPAFPTFAIQHVSTGLQGWFAISAVKDKDGMTLRVSLREFLFARPMATIWLTGQPTSST